MRTWPVRIFLFCLWGACSVGFILGAMTLSNAAGGWGFVVSFLGGGVYTIANLMLLGDD